MIMNILRATFKITLSIQIMSFCKDRQRERERDRQTDRHTDRQTDWLTEAKTNGVSFLGQYYLVVILDSFRGEARIIIRRKCVCVSICMWVSV